MESYFKVIGRKYSRSGNLRIKISLDEHNRLHFFHRYFTISYVGNIATNYNILNEIKFCALVHASTSF